MTADREHAASILAIGSELLGSDRLDTNSLWLTGRLEMLGFRVVRKACVGDDLDAIAAEFQAAFTAAPLLVVTGGLGPTADDLTREAAARFFGRNLSLDEEILEQLRARFARRGIPMPEVNEKQALVIDGAETLANPKGSAPGAWVEDAGRRVALLPGVPHEMRYMFEHLIEPKLGPSGGKAGVFRRTLRIAAMGESSIEERAQAVYARWPESAFTILASPGEVELRLAARGAREQAMAILDAQTGDFERALPGRIYGRDQDTLEAVVIGLLARGAKTLSVAESCSGGWIAKRLTDVPGASDVFLGGAVAYSNRAKAVVLGVDPETIARFGAVSSETACEMAGGALRLFESDYALAVTGVAGPGGGSPDKPVGTVWIAIVERGRAPEARLWRLPGDRDLVRAWTVAGALETLRRRLTGTVETA